MSRKLTDLQQWECLMKRIVWKQLGDIRDKKILDFGSGIGVTMVQEHFAIRLVVDRGLRVWDISGRHDNNITGPADGDSALTFGNINTNSVHNRYAFEMY